MSLESIYIFSIRPEYAEAIFSGRKKFELRRGKGKDLIKGGLAIVYVSGRVKAILGEFTIGRIIRGPPEKIWRYVRKKNEKGISPESWKFIAGAKTAIAIEVLSPKLYEKPVSLREIREVLPTWTPPMGYSKINKNEPIYQIFLSKLLTSKEVKTEN